MTIDKTQMTTRQKVTGVLSFVIIAIVIWQGISLLSGGSSSTSQSPTPSKMTPEVKQAPAPQAAKVSQPQVAPQQQADLVALQQSMQEKYVAVLNELQMLKLSQELAETNNKIASAKLATVKAQKDVVDLLTPPAPTVGLPATVSQGLAGAGTGVAPTGAVATTNEDITYTVVSVSRLQDKWNAVVGYQTKLYSVFVGDVLPPDGSTVVEINKYGIVLEKNGVQRKESLVPVI